MTKETKVGLLVGLALIIVVGILLSDHVANSSRQPQAILSNVGNNVRDSVAIPQPVAIPVVLDNPVGPASPVPTQEELKPQTPVAGNLVVGIGPGGSVKSLTQTTAAPTVGQTTMPLEASEASDQPAAANENVANPSAATPTDAGVTPIALNEPPSSPKALKQYKVQSGDTLGKLAHRFYGTRSHAAIEAILKANPELKGDPTRLAIGRTYVIPAFGNSQSPDVAKVQASTDHAGLPSHAHAIASTYTVKSGDTLWKIASQQLGSSAEWKQIAQLNHSAVKGGTLTVGMVLKLPAKTVASAN